MTDPLAEKIINQIYLLEKEFPLFGIKNSSTSGKFILCLGISFTEETTGNISTYIDEIALKLSFSEALISILKAKTRENVY